MTKKHYEAIAAIIANEARQWEPTSHYAQGIQNMADALADYFAKDNPLFSRDKFMKAISDQVAK